MTKNVQKNLNCSDITYHRLLINREIHPGSFPRRLYPYSHWVKRTKYYYLLLRVINRQKIYIYIELPQFCQAAQ